MIVRYINVQLIIIIIIIMGDEWDRQHADHRSGRRVCIEDDVNIV